MVRQYSHFVNDSNHHSLRLEQHRIDFFNLLRMPMRFRDAQAILEGLFTEKEASSLVKRWQIVKWLWTTDLTYREIARYLHAPTQTVACMAANVVVQQATERPLMFDAPVWRDS